MGAESLGAVSRACTIRLSLCPGARTAPKLLAPSRFPGIYSADSLGRSVNQVPYTWMRTTTSGTETLDNEGRGNPVQDGTGLVRSAFRPSDDAYVPYLILIS
jgi:hypothetical protein